MVASASAFRPVAKTAGYELARMSGSAAQWTGAGRRRAHRPIRRS